LDAFLRQVGPLPLPKTSTAFLIILNATGNPSCLLIPFFSDHYLCPLRAFSLCSILTSISIFSWSAVPTLTSLYIFPAFFGLFRTPVQALFTTSCASLSVGKVKMGT
ncbi:hypothetical protein K469DRAFT_548338, partial [Zopfia rhizophila CBS 207.26]